MSDRTVHLEDAQPPDEVAPPVGEGVQASTEDHVLRDPALTRPSHHILHEAGSDGEGEAEVLQRFAGRLRRELRHQCGASVTRQVEGHAVVDQSLAVGGEMERASHGGERRGVTGYLGFAHASSSSTSDARAVQGSPADWARTLSPAP